MSSATASSAPVTASTASSAPVTASTPGSSETNVSFTLHDVHCESLKRDIGILDSQAQTYSTIEGIHNTLKDIICNQRSSCAGAVVPEAVECAAIKTEGLVEITKIICGTVLVFALITRIKGIQF
jgi:hypothetical protein